MRRLGISDDDFVNTQRWIKEHSQAGDTILPRAAPLGWQVFSGAPMSAPVRLFTTRTFPESFALRYDGFVKRVPSGANLSWREMVQFGRREGTDWIVVDERGCRRRDGDPAPRFSAGPYHVFQANR